MNADILTYGVAYSTASRTHFASASRRHNGLTVSWSSAQRSQAVDGGGQGEIEHRQAARVVGGEDEAHLVPADVDVGMVVGGLGGGADLVDEGQRPGEVAQRHGGGELVVLALPGNPLLGQRGIDLGGSEHGFAHGWVISSGRTTASNCSAVR